MKKVTLTDTGITFSKDDYTIKVYEDSEHTYFMMREEEPCFCIQNESLDFLHREFFQILDAYKEFIRVQSQNVSYDR